MIECDDDDKTYRLLIVHRSKFNFLWLSGLSLTWMWWYKFFVALYEWCEVKKGKTSSDNQKDKAEKFEGDNFKNAYDWHIETLMKLKKKVNAYHKFMLELYSKVV